jgi:hypothetical protein
MTLPIRIHVFPELRGHRGPEGHNPEPPWMIEFGWIELRCSAAPGWVAFCETWYDAEVEIRRQGLGLLFRAVQRGEPSGDMVPVTGRYMLAIDPASGQLVEPVFPAAKSYEP